MTIVSLWNRKHHAEQLGLFLWHRCIEYGLNVTKFDARHREREHLSGQEDKEQHNTGHWRGVQAMCSLVVRGLALEQDPRPAGK